MILRPFVPKVMRTFGWKPTEEELKDMVNVIDQDGDGDISFNEFVWLMTRSRMNQNFSIKMYFQGVQRF